VKPLIFIEKAFISVILLLIIVASCKKEEIINQPANTVNLVIVTDNDPASYIMVRILGEVRSYFPDIQITYLQSKQFDIFEGAFLLNTAFLSFPEGTYIAGIVEPGAGSNRLVFQAGSQNVFAPDNGLSTLILHDNPGTVCYFVENSSVLGGAQPGELSFEDFYAKAICSLISGVPVSGFGTLCSIPNILPVQEPVLNGDTIAGQILFVDNFGNCHTNVPDSLIEYFPLGIVFNLKSDTIQADVELGTTYSSVPLGDNVCFINSSNLLEIAVNYGNFSNEYHLAAGDRFQLLPSSLLRFVPWGHHTGRIISQIKPIVPLGTKNFRNK